MDLVLDLDGTLIADNGDDTTVVLRPHLSTFLDYCFSEFTVHIWTAASPWWADKVLAALPRKDFKSVRCGASTRYIYSIYGGETTVVKTKDLKVYYDKDMTMIVDDTPQTFRRNYGNAVYIKTYRGSPDDNELLKTQRRLQRLKREALELGSILSVQRPRWYTPEWDAYG